ncbi:hypothetical protein FHR90_001753 [Endobacter medicaginis]|uniref:TonB-dependent receptor plug domain-containing protein n=1 Tax=Endobacter medicaginis TaxID=1181271 RepID=A0A850NKP0_9PROT|nr:TonB-dependent receptor plug domain-containing protein [Endobacter medicaginis]MBB3173921.1 hypothetical protein [Endobacter medicaginis]MCX5475958.1 TonB-dependent receptor plug domain-containing protein [Endobacter medicaginis]NVN29484.1 TonB-dependent receptor plug domain-containing protein [Endobacter medicaginis]
MYRTALLASAAGLSFLVLDDQAIAATKTKHHTARHASAAASAATTAAAPTATAAPVRSRPAPAVAADNIVVTGARRNAGGGMMRVETAPHAVQTVTRAYIDIRSPTSSPLDLIRNLPSVSVSTPDPAGIQGGAIQSRGLTDGDMGLLVDGAPASGAKFIAQNIDAEDVGAVTLTPGSSAISVPTTSAAAGVLDQQTRDPSTKAGGFVDGSYGTNNTSREYIRLESGLIGNSGVRSYVSFSNTHARSWMTAGINDRKHVDVGLLKTTAAGSSAKLFFGWNEADFVINTYPTEAKFFTYKHTGQGYGRSADAASTNYWQNYINHWNQFISTAPIHLVGNEAVSLDIDPYFMFGHGWSSSSRGRAAAGAYTYYDGSPVAAGTRLTGYYNAQHQRDGGVTVKANTRLDAHNTLTFGWWYDNNSNLVSFPGSVTKPDGAAASPLDLTYAYYNKGVRSSMVDVGYTLNALFVEDAASYLGGRLKITPGFKYAMSNQFYYVNTGHVGANVTAPLPHLSISYQLTPRDQIYVNAEGDYRQPSPGDTGNTVFGNKLPTNQYSISEQLGYRHSGRVLIVDVSAFNDNIVHRLLSRYIGSNLYSVIQAGSQTMRGIDAMVSTQPVAGFSPYASVEYLHATQDSDVAVGGSWLPTKGKQAVAAPRVLANFGLTYDHAGFFGNFSLHYSGPQSVTLMNDQRMPGFVTDTLALGYRFHMPAGSRFAPVMRLNFGNLTGAIVRTGPIGVIYNARATRLADGTILAGQTTSDGAGNSFIVEPRFNMLATLSTSF